MLKKNFGFIFVWMLFLFMISSKYTTSELISLGDQQIATQIVGTVVDEEGSPIPGVNVTLISKETSRTLTAITSNSGKFRFMNLIPGTYDIRVEMSGFATVVREDIYVTIGRTVDLTLNIDITGGIPPKPTPPPPPPKPTPPPPPPKIYEISLPENLGLAPITEEGVQEIKIAFYYSNKKIFAEQGIAKVGIIEKRLNDITEIPFRDENYIRDGLSVEYKCVYAIRIGKKENQKILLIRVIEIFEHKMKIEYYIESQDEKYQKIYT